MTFVERGGEDTRAKSISNADYTCRGEKKEGRGCFLSCGHRNKLEALLEVSQRVCEYVCVWQGAGLCTRLLGEEGLISKD